MNGTKEKSNKTKIIQIDEINDKSGVRAADDNVVKMPVKNSTTLKRFTIGGIIFFLFLLFYIPSFLNWMSGSNLAIDVVRNGVIEESVNANAMIIRDEELLKSPEYGGRLIYEIGEGEKTPAFNRIATVLNNESAGLLQDIEEINAKIVKARLEKAEKADFFSEDLIKLDKDIGLQVRNVINACNDRSFEELSRYRTEIVKIVEKKAEIVGESSTDNYINELKQQKGALQNKLNKNTVEIVANISGIVSYIIDGYENVLTPAAIPDLTPGQLETMQSEANVKQETDGKATAGKPAAKIIKGTDIYLAAVLDEESAGRYKAGDNIKLRINDVNIETTGTVTNISKTDTGRKVVTVRTSRGNDILSGEREVNVDFISKKEEGLKVPLRCLRNFSQDGGRADIMLIKFNVSAIVTVDIICSDEEYAIIKTAEDEKNEYNLNLYDQYIINPDNIKEGEIIEK